MEQLVTSHSDGPRWKGRKFSLCDFKEVREYIDFCLNPSNAPVDLRPALTSDFRLLFELVAVVDAAIAWPSQEEIDGTLKSLPERPQKPIEPRRPKIPAEFEDFKQMRADFREKIEHQRDLQLKGWSGGFATKLINKYEKLIRESERWEELHQQWEELHQKWVENFQAWLKEDALYESRLPEFREKIRRHGELLEANKESIPLKKIIVRLSKEIERAIEIGGVIEKVNWKILPSGEALGEAFNNHLEGIGRRFRGKECEPGRLERIWELSPERIFVGQDEFEGYYVFLFKEYSVAVLECPWVGNALYLIRKDRWEALSKLSKRTLLEGGCREVERLIHGSSGDWFEKLCSKLKRCDS